MRRFSQRNQLVTLNDINITPLLDLAFVLLIIFIITTPLLEGSIDLKLPAGGNTKSLAKPGDVVTVEVNQAGTYFFNRTRLNSEVELERSLKAAYQRNSNLVVSVRAAADGPYRLPATILDLCQRNGITRFKLNTDEPRR
jgi:biopolymer transport protein ExbD